MGEREVFSSDDELVVNQVCNILKENQIPCYKQETGTGDYLAISYGRNSVTKKKVIVSEENYEKAKNIIEFLSVSEEEQNDDGMPKELKAIKVDEFGNAKYRMACKTSWRFNNSLYNFFHCSWNCSNCTII